MMHKLVQFYTGLLSYTVFLAFFEFLGPVVEHLNYWGSKEGHRRRSRSKKLDPKNQLFLTLVKLKLNLKLRDLALRFGLSTSMTSRYLTTWICFLYQHLKEIDWMPTVEQVLLCRTKCPVPCVSPHLKSIKPVIRSSIRCRLQLKTSPVEST